MKKRRIIGCLVLTMLIALAVGCALADGDTTTLLVYMTAPGLEDAAVDDIYEMSEIEADGAISIVVLAGGVKDWGTDELDFLQGNTRNLMVIQDGYLEESDDWGSDSMAEAESLEEFLNYGFENYPADRMIVVLWDHGTGSGGGMCRDETAGEEERLSLADIDQALSALEAAHPDAHINILGCDACMMATYEMASMLSHHSVDYFVASEEIVPGDGYYYTGWLEELAKDPSISDPDLCGQIIETYMDYNLGVDPEDYMTLSAVDLSRIGDLESVMEQFAGVLAGQLQGGNLGAIRRGRSRMYAMGSFDDASWDMVDMSAMLDTYAQFDAEKAAEAKKYLSQAVILSSQTDNLPALCGMSVLIPQDLTEVYTDYQNGFSLTEIFPNWIDFLDGYVMMLLGGSYHFSARSVGQITEETEIAESYTPSDASLTGMAWDDETGAYTEGEGEETAVTIDAKTGFTAQLSEEDLNNLDYVEGMLLMDISDDEGEGYVELGITQDNLIDWKSGQVCSLFDGSLPVFGGQPVALYDQSSNDRSRRSLIPIKLNGEPTYLVVVFPAGSGEGRIIGTNAGYGEGGEPIRNTTKLKAGDVIIPVYTIYYEVEGEEDLQTDEFDGEEIIWEDGMTVVYEEMNDEDEPLPMLFCFVFNDIFGDYTMSEMVSFEL